MPRELTVSVLVVAAGLSCAHSAEQNGATQNNPGRPVPQNNPGPTVGVATMLADGTIGIQFRVVSRSGAIGDSYREYKPHDPKYEEIKRYLGDIKPGETKSFTLPPE